MPYLRPIAAALLASLAACASAQNTNDTAGAKDCLVRGPQAREGQTATWEGNCKEGFADGLGVLRWFKDGKPTDAYEGYLLRGVANGPGFALMADQTSYQGDFKDGKLHGAGKRISAKGAKLQAQFDAGIPGEEADYVDSNGNHYHGGWNGLADGPEGQGSMDYALGGRFEGLWHEGKPVGSGKITYPNGQTVIGQLGDNPMLNELDEANDRNLPRHHIYDDTPRNGVKAPRVMEIAVPFNLPYEKLNAEQRQYIKRDYPILQEQDEPPYPLAGRQAIFKRLIEMQDILCIAGGKVRLDALISETGQPQKVTFWKAPDAETARITGSILMLIKYKPALCAGQPCAMSYPLNIQLECH